MTFNEFLRNIIFIFVAVALSSCGDENSTDFDSTSIVSTSTLENGTLLLEGQGLKEILSSEVVENDFIQLELDGNGAVEEAIVGKNFVILAGTDERFPLGLSGRIVSISDNGSGSKLVTLSPLTLNDLVAESKSEVINIPLDSENFIGVVAPDAIQGSSDSRARRSISSDFASALGGGVVAH